jgi:hypothetical protein
VVEQVTLQLELLKGLEVPLGSPLECSIVVGTERTKFLLAWDPTRSLREHIKSMPIGSRDEDIIHLTLRLQAGLTRRIVGMCKLNVCDLDPGARTRLDLPLCDEADRPSGAMVLYATLGRRGTTVHDWQHVLTSSIADTLPPVRSGRSVEKAAERQVGTITRLLASELRLASGKDRKAMRARLAAIATRAQAEQRKGLVVNKDLLALTARARGVETAPGRGGAASAVSSPGPPGSAPDTA